ncbi:Leucine rich repeat/Leucine Rich Repeat [Novymonas esmeraldas]|uniref:Leucine rich repeat/Leucine Rich Repeat n=1 Tax=Novymonas esmeraldas TaxID=1808958 RepID=A0AAW0EMN6_9TRYP
MLSAILEFHNPAAPVPLAFSASSPAARRTAEGSALGFAVSGMRTHYTAASTDAELSSFQRPLRTICIHADTLPQSFHNALWWVSRDGPNVPVAFRAARLSGSLHFGVSADAATTTATTAAAVRPGATVARPTVTELSAVEGATAAVVRRCTSLFVAGSRLRELRLNPSALPLLERLDVSNCHCLRTVQWCSISPAAAPHGEAPVLAGLKVLRASFSGVVELPAARLAAWAPAVASVHFSGCRALSAAQMDSLLCGAAEVTAARLDGTRLTTLRSIVDSCPWMAELNVSGCAELRDASRIAELRYLRVLDLHGSRALASLRGVGGCRALRILDVSHCTRLTTLQPLSDGCGLPALQHLNVSSCTSLLDTQLEVLRGCEMLESVSVNGCAAVADVSALARKQNLAVLRANDTALASVVALQSCPALQELSVAGCGRLESLAPLQGLDELTSIDACFTGITRVAELVDQCDSLRVMLLRECMLDAESTGRLEARAARVASTRRSVHRTSITAAAAASTGVVA